MADPWKSISPEGVRAFTNGVGATLLIWLLAEGHLEPVMSLLVESPPPLLLFLTLYVDELTSLNLR